MIIIVKYPIETQSSPNKPAVSNFATLIGMSATPTTLKQGAQSVTSFNQLTFFQADINQSEVKDSFQLASDWITSVRKNGLLAVSLGLCHLLL